MALLYSTAARGIALPSMARIPGSEFVMGANDIGVPERNVRVSDYALGTKPITVADYKTYREDEPRRLAMIATDRTTGRTHILARGRNADNMDGVAVHTDIHNTDLIYHSKPVEVMPAGDWLDDLNEAFRRNDHPVVRVSYLDALAYIEWLNRQTPDARMQAGLSAFRLVTEAEWEHAAKGAGRNLHYATATGWLEAGLAHFSSDTTAVVRSKPALVIEDGKTLVFDEGDQQYKWIEAARLYDMTGNVWEWVQDWHGEVSLQVSDNPTGPTNGNYRVLRGGSWVDNDERDLRSAYRHSSYPDFRSVKEGFRLAGALQD